MIDGELHGELAALVKLNLKTGINDAIYSDEYNRIAPGANCFFEDPAKQAVHSISAEVAPHNPGSKSQGYVVGSTLFALAAKHSINWGWLDERILKKTLISSFTAIQCPTSAGS